ncbi:MAG: aldehyde ferredoxin oxidoreductase N-terminal domain-containing protein [Chloroflexota bacterium]|nr:aldehyde ferredoxin oxidoreductase N-terminal domain-containing protein [Chloroflexota bacterium]
MKEIVADVERFAPLHGWANRILRIDLSNGSVEVEPVEPYIPDYLGGRGLAARIAWEEYPEPVDALAPENSLMVMTGALTGTASPYSGRAAVCGFSPQAYPYGWFTRANIGAQWGAELKRAGYDGIIVTGASETPVQIVIRDDEVRIAPADHLWGLDTYETVEALEDEVDSHVKPLVIGPAGERLSRIATIHAATSSAAGQSGFGAVMGSKKLKAISVVGSGRASVAHPEKFHDFVGALRRELRSNVWLGDLAPMKERLQSERGGHVRRYACTASCPTPCNRYYANMPGVAYPERTYEGHMACVGSCFRGFGDEPISHGGLFDWKLGFYGGFEMNVLSNRYGLNQWDIVLGMVPWLERCRDAGLIGEMNGMVMDWQDPKFWAAFLHAVTYREGLGDALAEGGWRAAVNLDMGPDLARRHYTGWGYGGHWDGHADWLNYLVFPYWIVSALQWSTDTRDPYSSSHGYVQNIMRWAPLAIHNWRDVEVTWDHIRGISERVYGSPEALDPRSGYRGKAYPAYYHDKRSVMKDCVPTDDQVFPLIYSVTTEDRFFRVGEVEGPSVDYHLFRLGTGTEWSEEEFERAAERIYTLERALCVRHWGRDRAMDDSVLPSFSYEENWGNPLLEKKYALDRGKVEPVREEYYHYLGWDPETGQPTRGRLRDLGLEDVYGPMLAGAEDAEARRPAWPEWPSPEP